MPSNPALVTSGALDVRCFGNLLAGRALPPPRSCILETLTDDSMNELVTLLQRQFAYIRRQPEGRLLLVLPRLTGFLQSEPRLKGIVDELLAEYDHARKTYEEVDRLIAGRLSELWANHGAWFLSAWEAEVAAAPSNPAWDAWGGPPTKRLERLSKAGAHNVDVLGEAADPSVVGGVLDSMHHWTECVRER